MMPEIPRHLKITIGIMLGAVIGGAIYFRFLAQRIYAPPVSEEKVAQHLAQQSLASPGDVPTRVTLYLASESVPGVLIAQQTQIPLAAEPALRAKQVLQALFTASPNRASHKSQPSVIPEDAHVREVFLGPGGTAYVDFSSEFATHAVSGIESESLAVFAVVNTLTANVSAIQQVKILINGQEMETLAGHVDLDRFYVADMSLVAPAPEGSAPIPQGGTAQASR